MAPERWNRLQMIVHRNASETMTWAVLYRQKDGKVVTDLRLGSGTLPLPHGSKASQDPLEALATALDAWADRRSGLPRSRPLRPSPKGSASLEGPQGDTPPGLDSPDKLINSRPGGYEEPPPGVLF